jgi:hypothetical protein
VGGQVDSTRKLEAGPSDEDKVLGALGDRRDGSFSEEKLKNEEKGEVNRVNISIDDNDNDNSKDEIGNR